MDKLLFGTAYYDEYMPYERLLKDTVMMLEAGINVVRIGESTWSTLEPQNGVFDFTSLDRVLAAITQNSYGKGVATYIGCLPSRAIIEKVLENVLKKVGLWGIDQDIAFPFITKSAVNQYGKTVHFFFNFSEKTCMVIYRYNQGKELLTDKVINCNQSVGINPWGVIIVEEF